jgi:ribosome production factor 2
MAPTKQQSQQAKAAVLAGKKKAPKARIQRYLQSTESQLRENGKSVLLLKGRRASGAMHTVLTELRALQGPGRVKLLSKKNDLTAFDDVTGEQSLEFLLTKNDASLFAMATHNKKRPNNLILGRTFDHQLLDRAELGVLRCKSMKDYGSTFKKRIGSKPLMLFVGDAWQHDTNARNLQNLLTDFYRGDVVDRLVATGLDHVLVFVAVATAETPSGGSNATGLRVHQRTYHVQLKKNPAAGSTAPAPYLRPCGPDFDFALRRTAWADTELYGAARKQPASVRPKKKKNQSTNLFGETVGRLHIPQQRVLERQGRKSKALRRAEKMEQEKQASSEEEESLD